MGDDSEPVTESRRAVDGRTRTEIRSAAADRAPFYTGTDWDPESDGSGTALLDLFADLAADVVERLDQVPEKHRAAFVDTLGFDRLPPQPAELPLTVEVSDGAGGTIYLPSGTRGTAPAAEDRPELTFELTEGFEATPAAFDRLISVDPRLDHVATHEDVIGGGASTTLFGGPNAQRHHLYLGHADLLTLEGGTTVQLHALSTADAETLAALDWEYFGEPLDESADEGWRPIDPDVSARHPGPEISITTVERIVEDHGFELTTDDDAIVKRWLVATLLDRDRADPTPPHVDPARQPDVAALYEDLDRHVQTRYDDYPPEMSSALAPVKLQFSIETPFVETAVEGVDSHWLRASVPPARDPRLARRFEALELRDVRLATGRLPADAESETASTTENEAGGVEDTAEPSSGSEGSGLEGFPPDDLLANDVPLKVPTDTAESVRPFGTFPRVQDAFYIGSTEAFTKADQRVTISFQQSAAVSFETEPPPASWEYWTGSAWEYLDVDGSPLETIFASAPASDGTVSFIVPADLEPRTVSGHEGHWIRVRLIGNYGEIKIVDDGTEEVWQRLDEVTAPVLTAITVGYRAADSGSGGDDGSDGDGTEYDIPPSLVSGAPRQVVTENNLVATFVDPATRFSPFYPVPDGEQTLYAGFDGELKDGPLHLFADFADFEYPRSFHPRPRWEVYTGTGWERVSIRDDTEGLTERGVVRLTPPEATVPLDRFGVTRHWLRVRVSAHRFVESPFRRSLSVETGATETGRCGNYLPTTPPGTDADMMLPTTDLVAHNTGVASNVRTVRDEILGSSDGTTDQAFTVSSSPVREATLWVDERATLSAGKRRTLSEDPTVAVEIAGDEDNPDAVWVQWTEVERFIGSDPDDRHFAVDAVEGTVTFGDGTHGAVPPRGRDNIRLSYETGGGQEGAVPAGAVEELEGSLAFVDSVTNLQASAGAADAESNEAVMARAPKELRDRNRAVAKTDYERIARSSARKLARARCFPGLDPRGQYQPGWVTVLIVPRSERRKPVPSSELRSQVTAGLSAHAPATLLGDLGDERLLVRGPTYVAVTVEATVVAGPTDSLSELEATATTALSAYLHPLSGGEDGEGWPFGELPCVSDCYGVLEGVADVDHVEGIRLTFETADATRTIRPGQDAPDVNPDVLIHSGVHELDIVGGT